jgi:hypothetical protein
LSHAALDHPAMRTDRLLPSSLAFLMLAANACQSAPIDRDEAVRVLTAQAAQWNEGDLRAFVATYWDGPELTFFGKSGLTRGRDDLLATYERNYPTAKERGQLSFDIVDFAPLGASHALLLGRYRIEGEVPSRGVFSLVLAQQDGRIVILHDHTTGTGQ